MYGKSQVLKILNKEHSKMSPAWSYGVLEVRNVADMNEIRRKMKSTSIFRCGNGPYVEQKLVFNFWNGCITFLVSLCKSSQK